MRGTDVTAIAARLAACLALVVAAALALPGPASAAGPAGRASVQPVEAKRCADRRVRTTMGEPVRISLRCHGLNRLRIRWVVRPRHGRVEVVNQRRDWLLYRPRLGYVGRDRLVVARKRGRQSWTTTVLIRVVRPASEAAPGPPALPPPSTPPETAAPSTPVPPPAGGSPTSPLPGSSRQGPVCAAATATARYEHAVGVSIMCSGSGLEPLSVASGPSSGALTDVQEGGTSRLRTLTGTYTPDHLFTGHDTIAVRAVDSFGSASELVDVTVLPWRMRAIGDSVTAGFGYFGTGELMPLSDLLSCKPAAVVSNRCSSNSNAGPGYTGPPAWSPDFGLANNVSWAAQFANTWQGGGHITAPEMFQNLAVTGSAPSDWLPGGILRGRLAAIVAENPELVAMTLGANPLLSDLLLTAEGESCSLTFTVAGLRSCVQPFFDAVDLRGRLQQVYTALLEAPDTRVVIFQYSLSIPSVNLFSTWQLEAMIDLFNENIAQAVTKTKNDLPASKGDRLILIKAQTDPAAPSPTELPRFNTGLPPTVHDSWTGVYDCGGFFDADGPSHQSTATQDLFTLEDYDFCSGTPWIIDADSGIHPNRDGYTQFATALTNVAVAEGLIPVLP